MSRLIPVLILLLVGCQSAPKRADLPPIAIPVSTVTVCRVFVPIDPGLTAPCPIEPAGLPSEAPLIARKRAAALADCNKRLAEIAAIQGTQENHCGNPAGDAVPTK